MKITDVTLTLFAWESIPSTIYGHHTARPTGKSDRRLRHCAVGYCRKEGGAADSPADRHDARPYRRLCQLRDPRLTRSLCRPGPALPIDRLARLQDPPAAILARRHQGVRGSA